MTRIRTVWGVCLAASAVACGHAATGPEQQRFVDSGGGSGGSAGGSATEDGRGGADGDDAGLPSTPDTTEGGAGSGGTGGMDSGGMTSTATGGSAGASSGGSAGTGGQGPVPMEPREVPYRALALATSQLHTCVLLDDHQVKCFGSNYLGMLGLGDLDPRSYDDGLADEPVLDMGTGRSVLSLSAGRYTTCAVLDDHSVKCWGYSVQLGGPMEDLGDEPGEMGDNLPTIDLGEGRTAQQVALSENTAYALLDDGNIRDWSFSLLPSTISVQDGTIVELAAEMGFPVARFEDGTVSVIGGDPATTGTTHATFLVSDGQRRVCAALDNGLTLCNSSNSRTWSQTSYPPYSDLGFLYLNAGYCVITLEGSVRCGGALQGAETWATDMNTDANGTLEVRLGGKAVALGSGGNGYMCAIMEDGTVKCWGSYDLAASTSLVDGVVPPLDLGMHTVLVPAGTP